LPSNEENQVLSSIISAEETTESINEMSNIKAGHSNLDVSDDKEYQSLTKGLQS
jgi:hypothetical protein